jgi:hypothetical protein
VFDVLELEGIVVVVSALDDVVELGSKTTVLAVDWRLFVVGTNGEVLDDDSADTTEDSDPAVDDVIGDVLVVDCVVSVALTGGLLVDIVDVLENSAWLLWVGVTESVVSVAVALRVELSIWRTVIALAVNPFESTITTTDKRTRVSTSRLRFTA